MTKKEITDKIENLTFVSQADKKSLFYPYPEMILVAKLKTGLTIKNKLNFNQEETHSFKIEIVDFASLDGITIFCAGIGWLKNEQIVSIEKI